MPGTCVDDKMKVNPPEFIWGNTLPLIRRADYVFGNLEYAIPNNGGEWIGVLRAAGVKMVTLANKRSQDNKEAFSEEISLLKQAKIKFAGLGISQEPKALVHEQINHERIGVLSITEAVENDWAGDKERLLNEVSKAQIGCDWLIAVVHWGGSLEELPPREHIELGHALINAGAKIVYGHSPHVCRGIEVYNEGLIMYSTGDFIDNRAVDKRGGNELSMIFGLEGNKGNISKLYLYPTVIKDCQARMAEDPEREVAVRKMKDLCTDLGTKTIWNATRGRLDVVRYWRR